MITAVDTSILSDFFGRDRRFGASSRAALAEASSAGQIVACAVVWAEIAAGFPSADLAGEALTRLEVQFSPSSRETCALAGDGWRKYRAAGGPRSRLISDFLIAAHAARQADRLLSRDRGFARQYFPDLVVIDPSVSR
jgi:hypothetical protein